MRAHDMDKYAQVSRIAASAKPRKCSRKSASTSCARRCRWKSPIQPDDGGITPVSRRRRAYAALILGTIMTAIDASIANIALPTIGRELHVSPASTVWVASSYLLAITASLFGMASLGQSRGATRIWGVGVALFTLGSLLCALSGTFALLIFARVLQGVGAAAIMSLSPALVRDIYPRSRLGHAFGLNAMYTSIAAAAGPPVGGMLLAVHAVAGAFRDQHSARRRDLSVRAQHVTERFGDRRSHRPAECHYERARFQRAGVRIRRSRPRQFAAADQRGITVRRHRVRLVRAAAVRVAGTDDLARSLSHPALFRRRAGGLRRLVGLEHRRHRVAVLSANRSRHDAAAIGTADDVVAGRERRRRAAQRSLRPIVTPSA